MADEIRREYRRVHEVAFAYAAGVDPDPATIREISAHEDAFLDARSIAQKRKAVDGYAVFLASHGIH